MSAGNLVRVVAVLAACVIAAGSATSSTSSSNQKPSAGPGSESGPPPPQQMEPAVALGLWRSTFGAVKIEPDDTKGGLDAGSVHGIWVYQRQGQEVVGYFSGNLRGNVLEFRWQEPTSAGAAPGPRDASDPGLTGEGFLVFDVQGRQYTGRWWSDRHDRVGDWSGWRQGAAAPRPVDSVSPYGGQGYGELQDSSPRRPRPTYRPQQPPPPQGQQTYF